MATAKLIDAQGAETGTVELNTAVFDVDMVPSLVHEVAVALMNARRQGNHETKTRKEVRGGGRKPFRQKGTGNARQGSTREPQMRGGGTVFGPHKRSYRQNVPVAVRRKAVCCLLTDRVRGGALQVLEGLPIDAPKTKAMASLRGKIAAGSGRLLIVTENVNEAAVRSADNLAGVEIRTAADVNALDLLAAKHVVLERGALSVLEARLQKRPKAVKA